MQYTTKNNYTAWAIIRFFKRFTAYVLVFPALVMLYPFTSVGNWLGAAFYKLRGW